MFVFGVNKLRANPGNGRDLYDDRVPEAVVSQVAEVMKQPSPGMRSWITDMHSKFGFQKDPQFYEGMLCGLVMVSQLIKDLSEDNPAAVMFYSGLRGLTCVQAGLVAKHVAELREELKKQKEAGDAPQG